MAISTKPPIPSGIGAAPKSFLGALQWTKPVAQSW